MTSEVEERPRVVIALYGGLGVNGLTKKAQNPNFAEFLAFWGLFGIGSANLSQKDPSFGKLGHVINPLNPRAFCKKRGFLDILVLSRLNLGQITFNAVKNALAGIFDRIKGDLTEIEPRKHQNVQETPFFAKSSGVQWVNDVTQFSERRVLL